MHTPDFETFTKLAKEGNLIPVYREILADTETPVTALMKLADRPHLFLLESVEGGEKWGRYSFLGADLLAIFRVRGDEIVIEEKGSVQRRLHGGDPLRFLKESPQPLPARPGGGSAAVLRGRRGVSRLRHGPLLRKAPRGGSRRRSDRRCRLYDHRLAGRLRQRPPHDQGRRLRRHGRRRRPEGGLRKDPSPDRCDDRSPQGPPARQTGLPSFGKTPFPSGPT